MDLELAQNTELIFGITVRDKKSLREVVLESLRHAIVSGKIQPGQHLKERELAEAMGISTTPIKEALRILSHEGWVETFPRRGTFVSEMVNSSIRELMMLKGNLESLSARWAAEKITAEELEALEDQVIKMEKLVRFRQIEPLRQENTRFHMMIRLAAKNPVIYQMIQNVVALDYAFRERTLRYDEEVEAGFLDHKVIFEAIKERNANLAEERMKKHISRSIESVLRELA